MNILLLCNDAALIGKLSGWCCKKKHSIQITDSLAWAQRLYDMYNTDMVIVDLGIHGINHTLIDPYVRNIYKESLIIPYSSTEPNLTNIEDIIKIHHKYNLHNQVPILREIWNIVQTTLVLQPDLLQIMSQAANNNTLRSGICKLFQVFYQHKGTPLTLAALAEKIWGFTSESHINTLYSYIHELRVFFEHSGFNPDLLARTSKGKYMLKI